MFAVERIDHVGFTAHDVEALAAWYESVFGMRREYADEWPDVAGGHPLMLGAGLACIALFASREGARPRPAAPDDPNEHVALVVDRLNFNQAQRELDERGIEYTIWDHGICDSLYLRDPEGHQIELTAYRDRATSGPMSTRSPRHTSHG